MQMKCAECDCFVERGERVRVCAGTATASCCCTHIPMAQDVGA